MKFTSSLSDLVFSLRKKHCSRPLPYLIILMLYFIYLLIIVHIAYSFKRQFLSLKTTECTKTFTTRGTILPGVLKYLKNLFLISSVSFQSCDFLSWGPNITALSAQGCLNNQPTGSLFGGRFAQIKDNRKSHRNKQLPVVFALQIKVSHSMCFA